MENLNGSTIDASTFVSRVSYERIPRIKESVISALRNEIEKIATQHGCLLDYDSEIIETIKCRHDCTDNLLVTMKINAALLL